MKIQYANNFVHRLGMGNPTTCVYQLIFDENDINDTKVIQYLIMHLLVVCIKVYSYVAHMFYAWSFSHNKSVTIAIKKNKYFLSLNTNTTVFSWGYINSNKIECNN